MSAIEQTLREVVETLAPLDRTPCSPGERRAAEWLAERFAAAGAPATLEDEPSWGTFPPTATGLGVAGLIAGLLVLRGRRAAGLLLAAASVGAIVDEADNGPRLLRRLVRRRKATVNVLAAAGDLEAERTLVVIAHHDAPQAGVVFGQGLQRRLHRARPQLLATAKTSFPHWWPGVVVSLLTAASAVTGRRAPARAGAVIGALATALVADIWRNPTVPGANDNLSGVAALVALAELLRDEPAPGLRVELVSCGAEETLQDGIRAFVARHRERLDPAHTVFVNLDTIGSPHLVMIEAEGPFRMQRYAGPWLSDALARCAERTGVELERGFRMRVSSDSVIPSRAGYPVAMLGSLTDWRSPANYHQLSDTPANLEYGTVADATRLVRELIDQLAADATRGGAQDAAVAS
ncbi:MAG: M28 family peptidase [Solirubrobacteraceae bacterium]